MQHLPTENHFMCFWQRLPPVFLPPPPLDSPQKQERCCTFREKRRRCTIAGITGHLAYSLLRRRKYSLLWPSALLLQHTSCDQIMSRKMTRYDWRWQKTKELAQAYFCLLLERMHRLYKKYAREHTDWNCWYSPVVVNVHGNVHRSFCTK